MRMVTMETENRIAVISINRPKALNALNREIVDEIDAMIDQVSMDSDVRCLIFHSENNFAAGADIKVMASCNEEKAKSFCFSSVYNKIAALPLPTIAAIEGYALGGGLELALTADIRIAAEGAKLGFPETTLGIFPGAGGTIRTPRLIGAAMAKELIFTGDRIDAGRALQIGLVNRVVEDGHALEEAKKIAARIARCGPLAVKMAKEVISRGLDESYVERAVGMEAGQWAKLFSTYDQKEGMRAFMERRKPVFENR